MEEICNKTEILSLKAKNQSRGNQCNLERKKSNSINKWRKKAKEKVKRGLS